MTDYSAIKAKLLDKQQELADRIKATQATEGHEVEEGLDSNAQLWEVSEVRDGLDDEAATELNQVNDALVRLDAGEYGFCKSCGNTIGQARLEAMPFATLCIDCAEDSEDNADQEAFDPDEY
jgi:RNA polymerase-binding protein DksA